MCGIAGALVFKESDFSIRNEYITKMMNTEFMKLRGPDGGNIWISKDRKVALAHRRLSIIDLSDLANQPMRSDDQQIIVSFNGEIYNHEDIKSRIKQKYTWRTDHSDTEVLLHAYEEWGTDCVKYFKGMFAFAIWDQRKEQLFLFRDRLGIKPLYYGIYNGRFVFSSDINSILEDSTFKREVNIEALSSYFTFLTVPAPQTLFKNIYKLKAGNMVSVTREGIISEDIYWDMLEASCKKCNSYNKSNCDELHKELIEQLSQSVNLRKVSDVPMGVFLSGGIDSSINAVLFSQRGKEPINTFTVRYTGNLRKYSNEDLQAQKMSDSLHANHHTVSVSPADVFKIMPWLIKMMGEPLGDPVSASQYYVAKEAHDHGVIVCQIGEGADELFAGYPIWLKLHLMSKWSLLPFPKNIKKYFCSIYSSIKGKDLHQYDMLERYYQGIPPFWTTNLVFTRQEKHMLLGENGVSLEEDPAWKAVRPFYERFQSASCEHSVLNWMTYIDLNIRMSDLLLPKVDKMCMAASLEARVPFLDADFVAFVMGIPERLKFDPHKTKVLLKEAARGVIPEEIIERKKTGFALPISDWYGGDILSTINEEILSFVKQSQLLHINAVKETLEKKRHLQIWALYTLAIWWKEYFVGNK